MRRKLADLLINSNHTSISRLIQKTENIERYQRLFAAALPVELRGHICFATLNNGLITAIAPNAVLATQAKLLQSDILKKLRNDEEFCYAWQIKVKVSPSREPSVKKPSLPVISKNNAKLLMEEAQLCDDNDIAEVLFSLASHTKKPAG